MKKTDMRSMGELTNRVARLFRRLADRRLQPLGFSAGHLPVLTALMSGEALSQKALTEWAGTEQPTMAATLSRMERDGTVVREVHPDDGRAFLYRLSADAREKAAAVRIVVQEMTQDSLSGLSAADEAAAYRILSGLIAALENELAER